jgi:hypothetical protein
MFENIGSTGRRMKQNARKRANGQRRERETMPPLQF